VHTFRLRQRDPDAPEWLAIDGVYAGELDRDPAAGRVWLHHPAGPHAGKYLAAVEDVELIP